MLANRRAVRLRYCKIAISLIDQRSKRVIAWLHQQFQRAYNAVMRRGYAQTVILTAACLLAGKSHAQAQVSGCPASLASASDDRQPSGPEISIAEVTFSGPIQLPVSDQDQIAALIRRQHYGDSPDGTTDYGVENVRAGWQNHGYFKVKVSGAKRTLTSSPASRRIALSFHVEEGLQYSLDRITFKNYKLMADVSAVRRLFPINDGDIFSREKIATGLQNLSKAYAEMGYINFTSVPDTSFDDENKLISLEIDMDEGKQFYVSSVKVLGLDEPARQELLTDLPIKRGQIYTSRLWELALRKYGFLFPDCKCGDYERRLDEKAGTVALTLDFRPCSD
jgi:outer membrane protein insertion porin family